MMLIALTLLCTDKSEAQKTLPVNRYNYRRGALDVIPNASSFAYSLRKLRIGYSGFAVKVRRGTDNAEANVAFDATGVVSGSSSVTVTAAGGGLTVGTITTYTTFKSTQQVFVTTWYDQGKNAYNATQTTNAIQPELLLAVAGTGNTKPAILFNGTQYLKVGRTIETLLTSGITGSFLLWTKPNQNVNQENYGMWKDAANTTLWRWSFHINWSDGNCYFDAAEGCCATARSFVNTANIGAYNQYSFIRGTTYKTVRINQVATTLNNSAAASTAQTGGDFYIGWCLNATDATAHDYVSELIMFPVDLTAALIQPVEANQMNYWK